MTFIINTEFLNKDDKEENIEINEKEFELFQLYLGSAFAKEYSTPKEKVREEDSQDYSGTL